MQHAINKQINISTTKHTHLCKTDKHYKDPHIKFCWQINSSQTFFKTSSFQSFWNFKYIDEKIIIYNKIILLLIL